MCDADVGGRGTSFGASISFFFPFLGLSSFLGFGEDEGSLTGDPDPGIGCGGGCCCGLC